MGFYHTSQNPRSLKNLLMYTEFFIMIIIVVKETVAKGCPTFNSKHFEIQVILDRLCLCVCVIFSGDFLNI